MALNLKTPPVEETNLMPRETPTVDPNLVTVNNVGFVRRDLLVRLPQDAVADDLKDPKLWRKVQATANALRRHDALYIISYDESWVAEAIVADADRVQAILAKPRLTHFPERFDRLFQDDKYRVVWMGAGYVVERKADGVRMTRPVDNATLAERDLVALYPRRD